MEKAVSALEKELEEKRYGKYVLKMLNPAKWPFIIFHPIATYRGSATATRLRLRALRAQLESMKALRKNWRALCEAELKFISEHYKKLYTEEPKSEDIAILKERINALNQRHAELRNLAITAVFGKRYIKATKARFRYLGILKPSSTVARLAVKNPVDYVNELLANAAKELQKGKIG